MLLVAISVQAQTIADAARQERARQARLKSTITIKEVGTAPPSQADKAPDGKKLEKPPAPDPVEVWNGKMDQLRAQIKDLQDQQTALQLQKTQLQNQVYAPVVDPAAKDQAQAQLNDTLQQLSKVDADLDSAKRDLDAMQLEGPPKK